MQRIQRSFAALAVMVAAALVAAPVHAQMPVSFGVGGGLTLPSGDLADATDNGYHGMVTLRAGLPMLPVHLRIDGSYSRLPMAAGFGIDDISTIGAIAALGYDVVPVGPGRLYALAGAGHYWSKAEVPNAERVGDFGWNAGAGVRMNLLAAKMFIEGRYHSVSTEGGKMTMMPITVGLSF
jgi:hypothetical protein